ncbi:MAG: hypothetical protein L0154_03890 [Chloroflexi bacterium]|nr:hypothetical protein [Chloroflexota bacterium]
MRNFVRVLFGLFFIAMAIVNIRVTINNPDLYEEFITEDTALLPVYYSVWHNLIVPGLPYFLVLLVVFEFAIGYFMLTQGKPVKWSLLAATVFTTALVPANSYTFANIILTVILVWLLVADDYDRSFFDQIKQRHVI